MAKCKICNCETEDNNLIAYSSIRSSIMNLIKNDYPDWSDTDYICKTDFDKYRVKYIDAMINEELGKLGTLDQDVIDSIKKHEIIALDRHPKKKVQDTFGARIADKIAKFGGSWSFILSFFFILIAWITLNAGLLLSKSFDPFPFILLNLILSCLAAIQAPLIMMSQNRQEIKDRKRAENDYKIDLKAEIEVRTLHEKVDHILFTQWTKMMNVHEMQLDILNEIKQEIKNIKDNK